MTKVRGKMTSYNGLRSSSNDQLSRAQHAEWDLNRIEKLSTEPSQGEGACIRGSEYILFEIID